MQQKPPKRKVSRATWLVLGVMIGVGVGAALGDVPVGVAVGIALGAGMGGPPHHRDTPAGSGPDGGGAGSAAATLPASPARTIPISL